MKLARSPRMRSSAALLVAGILSLAPAVAAAAGPTTTLVSVTHGGQRPDSGSFWPAVSRDGRHVAFTSYASDLVVGDTNGHRDVFVRDMVTGVVERVSVASAGIEGDGRSGGASISADGRYVAFWSDATNLVRGDSNRADDVFVHDRVTRTTRRVSVTSQGAQGRGDSWEPQISADGRTVVFSSSAANLVPGDRNGRTDVFAHALATGRTERISLTNDGGESRWHSFEPSVSGDGRLVAYTAMGDDVVAGDDNGSDDVVVVDRATGTRMLASVSPIGRSGSGASVTPRLSGVGTTVVFVSDAPDLVAGDTNGVPDVFARDLASGTTRRVSVGAKGRQADDVSFVPAVSADGTRIVFESWATNLVSRDRNRVGDIFVHDVTTGATTRVSVRSDGGEAAESSFGATLSGDGRWVAFGSHDPRLVDGYPDHRDPEFEPIMDVYLRGPLG